MKLYVLGEYCKRTTIKKLTKISQNVAIYKSQTIKKGHGTPTFPGKSQKWPAKFLAD